MMNFFALPDRQAYMESFNVIYKAKEFFKHDEIEQTLNHNVSLTA